MNFRKLSSLSHDEIDGDFEKSLIQISPAFIKDIVARFSIYYARQGQPEIEIEETIHRDREVDSVQKWVNRMWQKSEMLAGIISQHFFSSNALRELRCSSTTAHLKTAKLEGGLPEDSPHD